MTKLLCSTAYILHKPSHSNDSIFLLALQWSWPCPGNRLKNINMVMINVLYLWLTVVTKAQIKGNWQHLILKNSEFFLGFKLIQGIKMCSSLLLPVIISALIKFPCSSLNIIRVPFSNPFIGSRFLSNAMKSLTFSFIR